jgi:hypothetical protein
VLELVCWQFSVLTALSKSSYVVQNLDAVQTNLNLQIRAQILVCYLEQKSTVNSKLFKVRDVLRQINTGQPVPNLLRRPKLCRSLYLHNEI